MKLLKAIIRTTVEIPLAVTSDIFTLGGSLTDGRSKLKETYEEILNDLDDNQDE